MATGTAPARAALVGNPSDGYGGATIAVTVHDFGARATVEPAEHVDDIDPPGHLVGAALARFRRTRAPGLGPVAVRWRCDVPREVGLAGSSAIVIAVLRALAEHAGHTLPPAELAAVALAVETEDLGIAAGPQDRVVQAHEGLVAMDFAPGRERHERLDPALLPPLLLAWRAEAAEQSGAVHGDLRTRWERDERGVRAAMADLGELARHARDRLLAGDHAAFARAMDASFDLRRAAVALDPRHVRMVELARAHGAAANYAGSGGAVALTDPGPTALPALEAALAAEGCAVLRPRLNRP